MLGFLLSNLLYIGERDRLQRQHEAAQEIQQKKEELGREPTKAEKEEIVGGHGPGVTVGGVDKLRAESVQFEKEPEAYVSPGFKGKKVKYYATHKGTITYKVGEHEPPVGAREIPKEEYETYKTQLKKGEEPRQRIVSEKTGQVMDVPISARVPEGWEVQVARLEEKRLAGAKAEQIVKEARRVREIGEKADYEIPIHEVTKRKAVSAYVGGERKKYKEDVATYEKELARVKESREKYSIFLMGLAGKPLVPLVSAAEAEPTEPPTFISKVKSRYEDIDTWLREKVTYRVMPELTYEEWMKKQRVTITEKEFEDIKKTSTYFKRVPYPKDTKAEKLWSKYVYELYGGIREKPLKYAMLGGISLGITGGLARLGVKSYAWARRIKIGGGLVGLGYGGAIGYEMAKAPTPEEKTEVAARATLELAAFGLGARLAPKPKPPKPIDVRITDYPIWKETKVRVPSPTTVTALEGEVVALKEQFVSGGYRLITPKESVKIISGARPKESLFGVVTPTKTQYTTQKIIQGGRVYYVRTKITPTGESISKTYEVRKGKDILISTTRGFVKPDIVWTEPTELYTEKVISVSKYEFRADINKRMFVQKGVSLVEPKRFKTTYAPRGRGGIFAVENLMVKTKTRRRFTAMFKPFTFEYPSGEMKPSGLFLELGRTKYKWVEYWPKAKPFKIVEDTSKIFVKEPTRAVTTQFITRKGVYDIKYYEQPSEFYRSLKEFLKSKRAELKFDFKSKLEKTVPIWRPKFDIGKGLAFEYFAPTIKITPPKLVIPPISLITQRGKIETLIEPISKEKMFEISKERLEGKLIPETISIPKVITEQKPITELREKLISEMKIKQRTRQLQRQRVKQLQRQLTATARMRVTGRGFFRMEVPPPPPPKLLLPPLFRPKIPKIPGWEFEIKMPKPKYKPSLWGMIFGVEAARPYAELKRRVWKGIEIRPEAIEVIKKRRKPKRLKRKKKSKRKKRIDLF